jgi:hypothetical protein
MEADQVWLLVCDLESELRNVEQRGFLGVLRLNQYIRTKAVCQVVPLLALNSSNVRFFED